MDNKYCEKIIIEMLKGKDVLVFGSTEKDAYVRMRDFTEYLNSIGADYKLDKVRKRVFILPCNPIMPFGYVRFTSNPMAEIGFRGVIL